MILAGVDRFRVVEPLFEAVRVALSYRGEPYPPALIQGLSGAAFRIGGICPCAPTCSAAMSTADLARRLGYAVEEIPLGGEPGLPAMLDRIDAELDAGRPIVVWNAFTTAEWDIVCGHEGDTLYGYGSYAGADTYAEAPVRHILEEWACPSLGAIAIGEKVSEPDLAALIDDALEEAVRHGRSPRDRLFEAGLATWRFRDGVAAYDAWIRTFATDPARVPESGDRYCLGVYRATHRAAAEFCRGLEPPLAEAGAHFEAEADALDRLHTLCDGWQGWKEPDEAAGLRAAEILTAARDAYAAGIDSVAASLSPSRAAAAARRARVERAGGAVWIAGVQKLSWDSGRCTTFCAALAEALRQTPHPYDYADLMGYSGLAFRLRWSNDESGLGWCPSAAVGEMPDEWSRLRERTGWSLPSEWEEPAGRDQDALAELIVAEIDSGRPLLAYPDHWDLALVYGYEDGGDTVWLSDCDADEQPRKLATEQLGPLRGLVGEWQAPPPLRSVVTGILADAVAAWSATEPAGGYWYGAAAYDRWVADLRRYDSLDDPSREAVRRLDGWVFASLLDARRRAKDFLHTHAAALEAAAREQALRASGLFASVVAVLEPLAPASRGAWDSSLRAREAAMLAQARRLEGEAVAALRQAVGQ